MKKILILILTSLLLAGCASSNSESAKNITESNGDKCSSLNLFNWGEYIGEETIPAFEDEYGVKVNYSLFESNEQMYTKLQSGTKYDVLIPSDYMIERLINENLLQPLDKDAITNLNLLDPTVLNQSYDPNNTYSAPYFYGTVGIVYNTQNVDSTSVEEQGFNIFTDSKYQGKVFAYDSERDEFMIALKALGYSMNTTSESEIEEAYQWLLSMDNNVNPSYVTDEVIDAMINGEKDIALVYSGDATYILSENSDMAYYAPESGTNKWTDGMVIPANSECSALANEFINFMLEDETSEWNSEYVGYTTPNKNAFESLVNGTYEGISSYTVRDNTNDEYFIHQPEQAKMIADLWIKVKNN